MPFYSQHGEDIILDRVFGGEERGFFVEVGCIDGRCFSNTLFLEERGWRGLCVEAHAGYIELLQRNRPGSAVCHCAAGERDEPATFYANSRGSLSTLDPSRERHWRRYYAGYFTGFVEQPVQKVRLSTLFDQFRLERIDLLSLDVEGYEVQALDGLDLTRHRPRLLLVESESLRHEAQLDARLLPAGYLKSIKYRGNVFYFRDPEDARRIADTTLSGEVRHTAHPCDGGEDRLIPVRIDTGKLRQRLGRRLLLGICRMGCRR